MSNTPYSRRSIYSVLVFALSTAITFLAAGCVTVANELDLKKFGPKDRLYVGRIFINFNGNEHPKCELYVNSDLTPVLKLTEDNWVFYRTDRVEPTFSKIACYHESSTYYAAWHTQQLDFSKLVQTNSNIDAVYFGDVHIEWKIDDKDTVTAAENAPFDETSPKRIGTVKDSGELHFTVDSHLPDAAKVLKDRGSRLELRENLIHAK
jgi:hypothetical protein